MVERVRDDVGFDLLAPAAVPRLLAGDPVLTFSVLSVLLAERIAPSDLSKLLKGDVITTASSAIVEAITDFFRHRRTHRPATSQRPVRSGPNRPNRWSAAIGSPVLSG
jgi:hypothetical protein